MTALALALVGVAAATACPTCKDTLLENDPTAAGLVQGYFWSILFMMSMPFLILGCLGTYFYLLIRQARLNPSAAPHAAASPGAGASANPVLAQPHWKPSA